MGVEPRDSHMLGKSFYWDTSQPFLCLCWDRASLSYPGRSGTIHLVLQSFHEPEWQAYTTTPSYAIDIVFRNSFSNSMCAGGVCTCACMALIRCWVPWSITFSWVLWDRVSPWSWSLHFTARLVARQPHGYNHIHFPQNWDWRCVWNHAQLVPASVLHHQAASPTQQLIFDRSANAI